MYNLVASNSCFVFVFIASSHRQLITHLKVFAKFTNPRSLYVESSLRELYNEVVLTSSPSSLLSVLQTYFLFSLL